VCTGSRLHSTALIHDPCRQRLLNHTFAVHYAAPCSRRVRESATEREGGRGVRGGRERPPCAAVASSCGSAGGWLKGCRCWIRGAYSIEGGDSEAGSIWFWERFVLSTNTNNRQFAVDATKFTNKEAFGMAGSHI
jgi:hypothetical protein